MSSQGSSSTKQIVVDPKIPGYLTNKLGLQTLKFELKELQDYGQVLIWNIPSMEVLEKIFSVSAAVSLTASMGTDLEKIRQYFSKWGEDGVYYSFVFHRNGVGECFIPNDVWRALKAETLEGFIANTSNSIKGLLVQRLGVARMHDRIFNNSDCAARDSKSGNDSKDNKAENKQISPTAIFTANLQNQVRYAIAVCFQLFSGGILYLADSNQQAFLKQKHLDMCLKIQELVEKVKINNKPGDQKISEKDKIQTMRIVENMIQCGVGEGWTISMVLRYLLKYFNPSLDIKTYDNQETQARAILVSDNEHAPLFICCEQLGQVKTTRYDAKLLSGYVKGFHSLSGRDVETSAVINDVIQQAQEQLVVNKSPARLRRIQQQIRQHNKDQAWLAIGEKYKKKSLSEKISYCVQLSEELLTGGVVYLVKNSARTALQQQANELLNQFFLKLQVKKFCKVSKDEESEIILISLKEILRKKIGDTKIVACLCAFVLHYLDSDSSIDVDIMSDQEDKMLISVSDNENVVFFYAADLCDQNFSIESDDSIIIKDIVISFPRDLKIADAMIRGMIVSAILSLERKSPQCRWVEPETETKQSGISALASGDSATTGTTTTSSLSSQQPANEHKLHGPVVSQPTHAHAEVQQLQEAKQKLLQIQQQLQQTQQQIQQQLQELQQPAASINKVG